MLKTISLLGFFYAYTRKLIYVVMETNYCSLFTKFVHWNWIRTVVKFQESLTKHWVWNKKFFSDKSQMESHVTPGVQFNSTSPRLLSKKHPTLRFLTITSPSLRRKIFSSRTSANGWLNIWNFDTNIWSFMRTLPSENTLKFLIGVLREWDVPKKQRTLFQPIKNQS